MSRIVFIGFFIFMPFIVFAQFEGGTGTKNDPYQIKSLEQLQKINEYPESTFKLISDIDASETINWNEGKGFQPIGTEEERFSGVFDGNNQIISGLYINRENINGVGLFGDAERAFLKNVVLVGVSITGNAGTGGLVGIARASKILNSKVSGKVTGKNGTGGLAGSAVAIIDYYPHVFYSTVGYCNADVEVIGENSVGGLIGVVNGSIFNSFATGDIQGNEYVGGLVGKQKSLKIRKSYATGNVVGSKIVGGLVGSCDYYGMGQPVGYCRYEETYSTGLVKGEDGVGGLVGEVKSDDVIAIGYTLGTVEGSSNTGAVVGNYDGRSYGVFWDSTLSNQSIATNRESVEITALKSEQMRGDSAAKYMEMFDFNNIWLLVENDYPKLLWEKKPGWVELKYPINVTLDEYNNGPDEVIFKWTSFDTVTSFRLQVAEDQYFRNVIYDQESIIEDSVGVALNLESEKTYYWRVKAKNDYGYNDWSLSGAFETMVTTSIEEKTIPQEAYLYQNYPNPFNPSTTISYELSEAGLVKLEVFNLLGERIAILINENKSSGLHTTRFDATGLSSGFYIYRLETKTGTQMKKLLFLK